MTYFTTVKRAQCPSLLIVVPTLNSHLLLPRLLHSLQRQTWPHWHLLFIDGHSCFEHREWLDLCCAVDSRCRWLDQSSDETGIFGAMNQGFAQADPNDWVLFWGSDDWAPAPSVLAEVAAVLERAESQGSDLDLLVCRGRYADDIGGELARPSLFHPPGHLNSAGYRRALLFGATPPHQATLFGPSARKRVGRYSPGFRLSADLDYFLQLSRFPDLVVECLDLELVHMAADGISGQQTQRRLEEVRRAYRRAFGWRWWFPFIARYVRRLASLLERNR